MASDGGGPRPCSHRGLCAARPAGQPGVDGKTSCVLTEAVQPNFPALGSLSRVPQTSTVRPARPARGESRRWASRRAAHPAPSATKHTPPATHVSARGRRVEKRTMAPKPARPAESMATAQTKPGPDPAAPINRIPAQNPAAAPARSHPLNVHTVTLGLRSASLFSPMPETSRRSSTD
jgi:hypothetical protein